MLLAGLLTTVLAAPGPAATPGPQAYLGRWNVRITDAKGSYASGGFEIEAKDGDLVGAIVWRWGSFAPVKSVRIADGVLRMVREDESGRPEAFEARLQDGGLAGEVRYPDGTVQHFTARRAPALDAAPAPAWGTPVALFDGKTLAGWRLRDPHARMGWAVVDGDLAVVEPEGNADLVSERTFRDQKLHLEFNVASHSNSGVYLRGRYEIQILDNPDRKTALDSHGCGAVYSRIAPSSLAARPAGEWQSLDVTLVGRRVQVVLNGTEIVNGVVPGITGGALDPFEDRPGPLMLQGDHGKVRFRNIEVTEAR